MAYKSSRDAERTGNTARDRLYGVKSFLLNTLILLFAERHTLLSRYHHQTDYGVQPVLEIKIDKVNQRNYFLAFRMGWDLAVHLPGTYEKVIRDDNMVGLHLPRNQLLVESQGIIETVLGNKTVPV